MIGAIGLRQFLAGEGPDRAAVLADLDGCLVSGTTVLPLVPELFARSGDRLWIVSNNSTDTAETLSLRLGHMGLGIAPARIILAGEETLRRIAQDRPAARVALYASPALRGLAARLGLIEERTAPELAILARDLGFGFSDLAEVMHHAARGIPVIATNPDPSHPDVEGLPVPETGALVAALRAALPHLPVTALGKPEPDLARLALARAGVAAADAIFLGDTPETDGIAAQRAGIDFVLLRRPGTIPEREEVFA